MVILCLDYGERFVGVAITDPEGRIPLRHSVIDQRVADVFTEVIKIIERERVEKVLVGVPLSLAGTETQQTDAARAFMAKLRGRVPQGLEVADVDETLTSVEARRRLLAEGGAWRDEHAEAARLMLESYLRQ